MPLTDTALVIGHWRPVKNFCECILLAAVATQTRTARCIPEAEGHDVHAWVW